MKLKLDLLNKFSKLFKGKTKEEITKIFENSWNNAFKKNSVTYRARGDYDMDIRNLILTQSYILEPIVEQQGFKKIEDIDQRALAILNFVKNRITYIGDFDNRKVVEYWEDPEVTVQRKTGDCEDGAILILSLMALSGIPAYKRKICAGYVIDPNRTNVLAGHAYAIYLASDNEWYPLDWCYYYRSSRDNFLKIKHSEIKEYKDIWWTFNEEFTWAQTTTIVDLK